MIAANPPVETRKDSRLPKVRYWNGSQSRRTDGQWLSAQCTWEGIFFAASSRGRLIGRMNDQLRGEEADDCKIGKARWRTTGSLLLNLHVQRGPASPHA